MRLGEFSLAVAALDNALRLTNDEEVLFLRARALYALSDYTNALKSVDGVLDRHPDDPDALLLRADVLEAQGEMEAARRARNRARELLEGTR